jgi:HK97 family phage portal protein
LTFGAVYSCVALIASDIAKLQIRLVQFNPITGIWDEVADPSPFAPVLRKPNHYQTRIQFIEQWVLSKLLHGNTYVLKERDNRRIVTGLYVLDPTRVQPLVASTGDVYYRLQRDDLSQAADVTVPATEIIHDVMVALYHPLCGLSPLTACGLAASQGLKVQQNSSDFFGNASMPSGILTTPGMIQEEDAKRLQEEWERNYGGQNYGRVAVLGGQLKFEAMTINAHDAQLIEQLRWTSENVCTAFRVPPYMICVGPAPSYTNIEALTTQYYTQCLQTLIEHIELLLDEGLNLWDGQKRYGTEFDLDGLSRMDTPTRVKAAADGVGSGAMSPNEARARFFDLPPVDGGESPYLQQQNYSLAALAKRDAQADPFVASRLAPSPPPDEILPDDEERVVEAFRRAWVA